MSVFVWYSFERCNVHSLGLTLHLTGNMVKVQEVFIDNDDIMFLSLSVTPAIDSVPLLRAYENKRGVIDAKWNIISSDKKHIFKRAVKSYFAVVEQ